MICPECDGEAYVRSSTCFCVDACVLCDGTGKVDDDTPNCDGGVPLKDRLDINFPPTVEPPESHQVWIWIRSNPPRWEIRGTGAIF